MEMNIIKGKTHKMEIKQKQKKKQEIIVFLFSITFGLCLCASAILNRSNFVATCVPLYAKRRKVIRKNAVQRRVKTRQRKKGGERAKQNLAESQTHRKSE